jgi:hypothetical protein
VYIEYIYIDQDKGKVRCCCEQVQGFPSNAALFQKLFTILFKLIATCFSRTTIFKQKYIYICIYFRLNMVVRLKHVAVNLNKIVNNY